MVDSKKTTGIYYGEKEIYLVQVGNKSKPAKVFSINSNVELKLTDSLSEGSKVSASGNEGIAQNLQLTFNKNNLSPNNVVLSLPTRDIIFRSFVIPWMQSHEIKGVVDFEAGKYVPFPLEELAYSYHPLIINEGGNKRIRVTFVAIKKTELDKYTDMLTHAGIKVGYVEPSATSLIRTLVFKKVLKLEQTSAIVTKEGYFGKIIIVEQGVPQFVREFQLRVPTEHSPSGTSDEVALLNRLNNEIRISLDYFNRQNNQIQAKEIVFVSDVDPADAAKNLQEDIKLPTTAYTLKSIFPHQEAKGLGSIYAYGVSLVRSVTGAANFNLAPDSKHGGSFKAGVFSANQKNYKQTVLIAIIASALLFFVIYGTSILLSGPKNKLAELESKLSVFKDSDIDKLKDGNVKIQEKVDLYNEMIVETRVAELLDAIPDALPSGVWVNTMDIVYDDPIFQSQGRRFRGQSLATSDGQSKITVVIEGFAYLEDRKQQFKVVDDFVRNLREEESFGQKFTQVESGGKTRRTMGEYTVTAFTVTCK